MATFIHISDLHFPTPVAWKDLRGKMFSGYFNYRLRRKKKYPKILREALWEKIQSIPYDGLLITGDLTNVSSEIEFAEAKKTLSPLLDERTFIIPGNHDRYVKKALEPTKLFEKYFAAFLGEALDTDSSSGYLRYKILAGMHCIGLDSNLAKGFMNASGYVSPQIIQRMLHLLQKRNITKYLLLCHHPIFNPPSQQESDSHKLHNREELADLLQNMPPLAYLHGHQHSNWVKRPDPKMPFYVINSASSTMLPDTKHLSGFHVLQSSAGDLSCKRLQFNPEKQQFEECPLALF
ncbi:MAG: metallophosphoesterase [Spirochaetota bacterium]